MTKRLFYIVLLLAIIASGCRKAEKTTEERPAEEKAVRQETAEENPAPEPPDSATKQTPEYAQHGFVEVTDLCPDIVLDIRYFGTYNFVGRRLPGYEEPVALLTRRAAEALKAVSDELAESGYRLKIFDAYRPQSAVDEFVRWARIPDDTLMRRHFYPEYPKNRLFPEQFIASHSGHSRGSAVDLTLVDRQTGEELDMGTGFDYMGRASYTNLQPGEAAGQHAPLTEEQYRNRQLLLRAMSAHGWRNYKREWWHYTLRQEPYPDTYFNFPVRR